MNSMFLPREHKIHIFELTCNVLFYHINILMTAFLMIFRRFPTTFRRFPKICQIVSKARRTFPNIFREFPKISEDYRRLSRKTRRCFDDTLTNLRWLNRVMQDHEARASDLNRKFIFSFFLLFS